MDLDLATLLALAAFVALLWKRGDPRPGRPVAGVRSVLDRVRG